MSHHQEIDGVIKDAVIREFGETLRASGWLHGDRKGRFMDGEFITTSTIESGPDETGVIHTRNSVYRLEMRA